ncbi:queuosine-tRNA galactosyltransferase-like [Battus philenor]|uniref:queuosine-tRNA galactosyltransferase-like n=1 Tax=Battus philenor TaxID=42288 RepID=UPI0035D0FEBD
MVVDVSVIIPIHNGEKWINSCMKSIARQSILKTRLIEIEIVVYNDGSNDRTEDILQLWAQYFKRRRINFLVTGAKITKGVGAAKNGAVRLSSGTFLCFQDVDDLMHQDRILLQWNFAKLNVNTLVGSKITRNPLNSTPRFVHWANTINDTQLKNQIYLSYGPTILMPTWFCHRSVFENVGGFDETGKGTPEDLIFFYAHIDRGGTLHRVDKELVNYTYHACATTFTISKKVIQSIQLQRLEGNVLLHWKQFTVWNAGKNGRKFVRSLSLKNLNKVIGFCDVDKKKIGRTIELYCPQQRKVKVKLPVVHFSEAKLPLIICVKLDLTNGEFEKNLKSLNLTEGKDYFLFG